MIYLFILYLIFFALYLELNPKMTNVWYRIGSDGNRHVQLWNLIDFIIKPFQKKEFWYPTFWDLNFFIGVFTLILCYYIFHNLDITTFRIHVVSAAAKLFNLIRSKFNTTHIGTKHSIPL